MTPGQGLALLLDDRPPPFACVQAGTCTRDLEEDEGHREWLLARWVLRLDEALASDSDDHHVDRRDAGMHHVPALLNRRLAAVRRRAAGGSSGGVVGGLRRGPTVDVCMDKKRVYGGLIKMCRAGRQLVRIFSNILFLVFE